MGLPQQQQQNNQSLNEKFLQLFTGTSGVHAVTTINGYVAKDYFTKDLLNQQAPTRENVYMTLNTSKEWSRKKKYVCQINAITIDLDVYDVGMTIEHALYLIPEVLKEQGIHVPTAIQISGNGIYLHWKLHSQVVNNAVMIRLYEKITQELVERLKKLGADGKSADILHLFRMPGTLNVKKNKEKKESYIVSLNEDLIYELQDFTDELLPDLKPRRYKKKKAKTAEKRSVTHMFNPFTLSLARVRDLERLAKMRNYEMDGYRHHLLLYYAAFLTQANQDNYQEKVHALNDLLTNPIRENEVKSIFKTIDGKRQGDSEDPYELSYVPKNSTLIETFDMGIEEQAKMETIIGNAESRKRDRKRKQENYEPIKATNKKNKEQRDEQIHQLHTQGLSNTQIAKEMGVHRNTVANVLKAIKEPK